MPSPEASAPPAENSERIALALSGGGSRAMAFHLGCLRGLHKAGLLDRVDTLTAVSGGSVLAAIYCSHPGDFGAFEIKARQVLRQGFVRPAILSAISSLEGIRALLTFLLVVADSSAALLLKFASRPFRKFIPSIDWFRRSSIVRRHSRTTILRETFDLMLSRRRLADLRTDRPRLIIIACELRAKAAFYFTADRIQCWRYGVASACGVQLADAVSASAAYPLLLPALDDVVEFEEAGVKALHRITLTDGGVYDNLGLSPLWPGRDPQISLETSEFQRIIACRAGYGIRVSDPSSIWPMRMKASFLSVLARNENGALNRLFDLKKAGVVRGILVPYLDQQDGILTHPPEDFVAREDVANYPTDFSAMSEDWIDKLSLRGEQLVLALLEQHWPDWPRS